MYGKINKKNELLEFCKKVINTIRDFLLFSEFFFSKVRGLKCLIMRAILNFNVNHKIKFFLSLKALSSKASKIPFGEVILVKNHF